LLESGHRLEVDAVYLLQFSFFIGAEKAASRAALHRRETEYLKFLAARYRSSGLSRIG
jgi:hypothetical protein